MKLASRKLWIAIAAMLASVGSSIAGLQAGNTVVTIVGTICTVAAAAMYAGAEAYVDANRTYETVARDDDDRSDDSVIGFKVDQTEDGE